jgi:mannose-1-phosphate guanylyltransferase
MAGGAGTRLYPRSTENLPKQFQRIIGKKTLIEQTYERVAKIVDDDHIYVSSNHQYVELIKKYLPNIPVSNYITEPVKRNTGPAMALATALIYKKDKQAIITASHSDHLVTKEKEYVKAIKAGIKAVSHNQNYILCVGIKPIVPHTGFGYIEKGKEFTKLNDLTVYFAKRFVEKPSLKIAKKYLAKGDFFWNAGYFTWAAENFLLELKKYNPKIYTGIQKITEIKNKKVFKQTLDREFHKFENIAIDYLIMEKTERLLVLPADIGWSDVGTWDVVVGMVDEKLKDLNGNYTEGKVINIDTKDTAIFSHDKDRLIATVGLQNFIVVTTEKAIVIVPRGRSEEVKKIVEQLNNQG